jgi:hypothetical protein
MSLITCREFEILLADYLDGTLGTEEKTAVELHRDGCASCGELAQDAAGAVVFMERAATVDAPQALVSRIVLEVTNGTTRNVIQPSWIERLLGRRGAFVLQPRFAMSMAMAVLSLAMVGRFWDSAENRIQRSWDRTVKGYESMQLVYDVRSQLDEWAKERAADSDANPAQTPSGAEKQ